MVVLKVGEKSDTTVLDSGSTHARVIIGPGVLKCADYRVFLIISISDFSVRLPIKWTSLKMVLWP